MLSEGSSRAIEAHWVPSTSGTGVSSSANVDSSEMIGRCRGPSQMVCPSTRREREWEAVRSFTYQTMIAIKRH